ncbi:MAG: DUF309 domain-containing protein [Cyanobacteria bacterium]|nr:DUF309 domain-containing protein [Cyanobacteriota bacterium]
MLYQDLRYPLANYPLGVPELWDSGQFYACHEYLETAWMQTPVSQTAQRHLLQGLLQVAVAFHHHASGNVHGFQVLLSKGVAHLEQDGVDREAEKYAEAEKYCETEKIGCPAEVSDRPRDWAAFIKAVKRLSRQTPNQS